MCNAVKSEGPCARLQEQCCLFIIPEMEWRVDGLIKSFMPRILLLMHLKTRDCLTGGFDRLRLVFMFTFTGGMLNKKRVLSTLKVPAGSVLTEFLL